MAVVRILGVDPGTIVAGFGCVEIDGGGSAAAGAAMPLALRAGNVVHVDGGGRLRHVECGVIELGRSDAVAERLARLADHFRRLIERLGPHELALEEAFYGRSVQAALRIGEARGVVMAEAARAGLGVHQYPPARIKRCVSGNGDASKATVAEMVRRQLGGVADDVRADASDALAVAITRAEERRSPLLGLEVAEQGGAIPFGRRRRR